MQSTGSAPAARMFPGTRNPAPLCKLDGSRPARAQNEHIWADPVARAGTQIFAHNGGTAAIKQSAAATDGYGVALRPPGVRAPPGDEIGPPARLGHTASPDAEDP